MEIIKPVGVFLKERKFLVARDHDEVFFKNIGGRRVDKESDIECLRRTLKEDLDYVLESEPDLLFELPPTKAVGDPGDTVILKAYLISEEMRTMPVPSRGVAELALVNSTNLAEFNLTPQIKDMIVTKLVELDFID